MRRWLIGFGLLLAVRIAVADAPGADSLVRGIRAFEAGHYKQAQKLFDSALARGGLTRAQTLTAYVDLGVTLVMLGKTKSAEHAFEQAVLIDPQFTVPPHSGQQAARVADEARHKQEGVGYRFDAQVPDKLDASAPFKVSVVIPEEQVPLVPLVRFAAAEPGGKTFETIEPSSAHVGVEVPAEVAAAGADVTLRFELMDEHDNRLAIVEKQVRVETRAQPEVKPAKQPPADDATDTGNDTKDTGKGTKGTGKDTGKAGGDDGEGEDSEQGPWSAPHGSTKYTAVRTDKPPAIDGVLDDAIWQTAPKDEHFLSTKSKPFGKATAEPTQVQVAYDDQNLYVAFRCHYSKPHRPSDSFAADETSLFNDAENVAVIVDALHGHTGAYEFAVSPAGVRADAELSDQGAVQNLDWHGIWDVETQIGDDGWTAEFSIPWGTMYMPSSDEAFDVGINLARHEPNSGELALWTLHPPATELYDVNFFGHLDGLAKIHPRQRLLFLPYAAAAFDANAATQSRLTDFSGTNAQGRIYAGAYLRFHPPGPFRLDATFNPDFSAVSPDAAFANFDRFELEYPEARSFFTEDNPRFAYGGARYLYGDLGAQLYYSRRLGIITNEAGLTQIVPILWGVKSVVRSGGTEAALMNVETIKPDKALELNDNATIGRFSQTIEGQRFGGIIVHTGGASPSYTAGGPDAQLDLYDRHLKISTFFAGSRLDNTTSAAGEGTVAWKSQEVYAKATYLDIGKGFQAPLGFFPLTGVRAEVVAAGYTPVLRGDLVQQVFIDTQLSIVRDRDSDDLVYRRGVIGAGITTIDGAVVAAAVQPSTENVTEAFPIGSKIMVMPGMYKPFSTQFDLTSPPDRTFVFGLHYNGGDLYEGTRNAPGGMVGINLGRITARLNYFLYILKFPDQMQSFYGHDVSLNASFAYTPLARTSLVMEADTVSERAVAQVTTTVQFGRLSSFTLALRGSSGSTIDTIATDAFDKPNFSAILSVALGSSPF